jgi:hypothetical protein
MDRRDALKKLGMGGATVVGASMIVSSPALANPGTNDCAATGGNPTVTAQRNSGNATNGGYSLTINYTGLGTISCPCPGSPPASLVGVPTGWLLGATSAPDGLSATWASLSNGTFDFSFSIRVRCLDGASQPVCAIWSGGGSVTINANDAPVLGTPAVSGSIAYTNTVCA